MGYCEKHLKKEKGSAASEIVMYVCAVPFALIGILILCSLGYMAIFESSSVGAGETGLMLFFGAGFLFIGICFVWGARIHRKKRTAIGESVENSDLVQTIRAQLPPEQAGLPVPELFALVDRDLAGGQTFGTIDLGRTWILVGSQAVLLRRLRGIFLVKRVHTGSKVVTTSYEVDLYDSTRLIASVSFGRKGTAQQCCEALTAAVPLVESGGSREESAFLKALEEAAKDRA